MKYISSYTAIDTETTGLRASQDELLELAGVKVIENKVIDTFQMLIRPENPIPSSITDINGITNEMVRDAPPCCEALSQFCDFIGGDIILGHNVNFDIRFISCNLECFQNDYLDTLRIAREVFPYYPDHKLTTLRDQLGIDTGTAHRALADALATHECYQKMLPLAIEYGVDPSILLPVSAETHRNAGKSHYRKYIKFKDIEPDCPPDEIDPNNPFFGQTCVFTGDLSLFPREEAAQLVVNMGGTVKNAVSGKTTMLIVGGNDFNTGKFKAAKEQIAKGKKLAILYEDDFYDITIDHVIGTGEVSDHGSALI